MLLTGGEDMIEQLVSLHLELYQPDKHFRERLREYMIILFGLDSGSFLCGLKLAVFMIDDVLHYAEE
jgi:hypothetical protein